MWPALKDTGSYGVRKLEVPQQNVYNASLFLSALKDMFSTLWKRELPED